jgi:hypothetical protein
LEDLTGYADSGGEIEVVCASDGLGLNSNDAGGVASKLKLSSTTTDAA